MATQRMNRFDVTVLRQPSGSTQLVPAGGSTVECYLQGATVDGNQSIVAGATSITVFDVGAIKAGDTIIVANDATKTRVVSTVAGQTINVNAGAAFDLSDGDRLVPTTVRPFIYTEITGLNQVDSGNVGRAPSTGATSGAVEFYCRTKVLDLVASGGSLAATVVLEDQVGDMVGWDELRVEGWGGGETTLDPANYNNSPALTGAIAYAGISGTQPIKIGGGQYKFSATITTTGNTYIKGAGKNLTVLTMTAGSGALFDCSSGTLVLEDMTISRASGSDPVVHCSTLGAGIELRRCRLITGGVLDEGLESILEDVEIIGCSTYFLNVDGAQNGLYRRVRTTPTQAATYQIRVTGGASNPVFEDCTVPTANAVGVNIPAVTVDDATTTAVKFRGGRYSGNTGADGFVLTQGTGISLIGCSILTCDRGIELSGSNPAGIQLLDLDISKCQQEAIYFGGGNNIRIANLLLSSLSRASSGTYSAINIGQTVIGLLIDGVLLGNWAGGSDSVAYIVETDALAAGTDTFIRNVWGDPNFIATDTLVTPNGENANVFVAHNMPLITETTPVHEGFAFRAKGQAPAAAITVGGFGLLNLEAGGATNIDTLAGGKEGQILIVRNDSGNTQTIRDNGTGGGNVNGIGGADISMADNTSVLLVFAGTRWNQINQPIAD